MKETFAVEKQSLPKNSPPVDHVLNYMRRQAKAVGPSLGRNPRPGAKATVASVMGSPLVGPDPDASFAIILTDEGYSQEADLIVHDDGKSEVERVDALHNLYNNDVPVLNAKPAIHNKCDSCELGASIEGELSESRHI